MKVVVVGPQFPDSFARNISVTLSGMGHTVTEIGGVSGAHNRSRVVNGVLHFLDQAFPNIERSRYEKLVRNSAAAKADLVLVTTSNLPPEVVDRIRAASKAPVVCWYTDCGANLRRYYLLACKYDAVFLKEPCLVRTLRNNLGLNAHYLAEACNPLWHKKVEMSDADWREYGCEIGGAGTLHYYRARMLEPFIEYDLKLWGRTAPLWLNSLVRRNYTGTYVAEDRKSKAYRAAKIFINTISFLEFEGLNCTLFEAAGCGAFQIAESKPLLSEHFVPEKEIVTFRSRGELVEKVKYYLDRPAEREAIADRAYARAHQEHTYEHRLTTMLQVLGLADRKGAAQAGEAK